MGAYSSKTCLSFPNFIINALGQTAYFSQEILLFYCFLGEIFCISTNLATILALKTIIFSSISHKTPSSCMELLIFPGNSPKIYIFSIPLSIEERICTHDPKSNKAEWLGWALVSQNPLYSLLTQVSHLLPRPTERIQLLSPHKRYWSEILRISSNSPNLFFGSVLVNLIGSRN